MGPLPQIQTDAQAWCAVGSASLAEPRNSVENRAAGSACGEGAMWCWLGAHWVAGSPNTIRWDSDNAIMDGSDTNVFSSWSSGEPSGIAGAGEQCVETNFLAVGEWNDLDCVANQRTALCQK